MTSVDYSKVPIKEKPLFQPPLQEIADGELVNLLPNHTLVNFRLVYEYCNTDHV